jgi:hypothetical protein
MGKAPTPLGAFPFCSTGRSFLLTAAIFESTIRPTSHGRAHSLLIRHLDSALNCKVIGQLVYLRRSNTWASLIVQLEQS